MASVVRRPLLLTLSLAMSVGLTSCGDDSSDPTSATASSPTTSAPTGGGLTVAIEPSEATAGSTLEASVENGTAKEFTYGAAYEIDRAVAEGWELVELPSRPVIEIGYVAPPGESGAAVEVELPDDLERGLYRVVIARDVPDVGDLVGEFEVTDG